MNRTEMVEIIARQHAVDAPVVDSVLRAFVDLVLLNVAVGEPVTIRGFGRFDPKVRPSAKLKHPRSGQTIETGERRTIGFRPSMKVKDALNPPFELGTDPNRHQSQLRGPETLEARPKADGSLLMPRFIATSGVELMPGDR